MVDACLVLAAAYTFQIQIKKKKSNFFLIITKKYADLHHQQSYRIAEEYFYLGAEEPSIRVWRRGHGEELGFGEEILGLGEIKLLLVAALMMEVDLEAMLVAFISPFSSCKPSLTH